MERTILVAEDSPTQAEQLRLLLEREGYRVQVVRNGREGLERVQAAPPDLIISDVVMPEMDGYAFTKAVKSSERTRRIPVVLLTERNAPADVIKGLERGADNFITKPFEEEYLLERLRRIFENLELRRQGHLDMEITLTAGGRQITINADKQQIIELLFATLEELVRANGRLAETQRMVEEYARNLEVKVEERTEQLLQAEKLATMGQLLAGVAHELNNPLSVVLGQASLLREETGGGSSPARVEKIAVAAERCARIVRSFLALARQHPPQPQRVALNQLIQEAVELLAYPLRVDNIEVTLNPAKDLPVFWADPNQLHQVVVNLLTNAQQAMRASPGLRRLTLTTQHNPERGQILLEVADTGPGVPREIQSRIFEPFFTTKAPGQGTGLGLSLCQGIVESHGGTIRLESEPGRGAVFVVELPAGVMPAVVPEARPGAPLPLIRGKAILVVDDEPGILNVLVETLSTDAHEVDTALDGVRALEKIRGRTYDLILTDLRMPELDGPGLYREVELRHPDLRRRFIFLTGDALSAETRKFLESLRAPCLNKPFTSAEAREIVQRALLTQLTDSPATGGA